MKVTVTDRPESPTAFRFIRLDEGKKWVVIYLTAEPGILHLCGANPPDGNSCENLPVDPWFAAAFTSNSIHTHAALDYICERCQSDWLKRAVDAWGGGA